MTQNNPAGDDDFDLVENDFTDTGISHLVPIIMKSRVINM